MTVEPKSRLMPSLVVAALMLGVTNRVEGAAG
jgi:hypothetical protein